MLFDNQILLNFWHVRFINSIIINWKISAVKLIKVDIFIVCFELWTFFPLTKKELFSPLQCQHKQNFVFALLRLILNFFSSLPKFPLIPKVSPSPKIKKIIFAIVSMRWRTIINTNNYNIPSKTITNIPFTSSIKCYSITTMNISLSLFFTILVAPNKQSLM